MKKLVKIWFLKVSEYSEDMVVVIPDNEDPDVWLEENKEDLVTMHPDFQGMYFDDTQLDEYLNIGAIGAKFVTGKPDCIDNNEPN